MTLLHCLYPTTITLATYFELPKFLMFSYNPVTNLLSSFFYVKDKYLRKTHNYTTFLIKIYDGLGISRQSC